MINMSYNTKLFWSNSYLLMSFLYKIMHKKRYHAVRGVRSLEQTIKNIIRIFAFCFFSFLSFFILFIFSFFLFFFLLFVDKLREINIQFQIHVKV